MKITDNRVWLDVPFTEKDEAKMMGARWDGLERRWFSPVNLKSGLPYAELVRRWGAKPPVPESLPGEDREFGGSWLYPDLVPSSCWFTNVRACVSVTDWERIRRMVVNRAENQCEVCGAFADQPRKLYLEVHERWDYTLEIQDNGPQFPVQTLKRLICLCSDCHRATHFGLAELQGKGPATFAHLKMVLRLESPEVEDLIDQAEALYAERSKLEWCLDLTILAEAGVDIHKPHPDAVQVEG